MVRNKVICEKCGREISKSNFTKHLRSHETHPENFEKETYHLDHDDLFCKFCGKECKNKNSLVQHEIRCKENHNKINAYISSKNVQVNQENKMPAIISLGIIAILVIIVSILIIKRK